MKIIYAISLILAFVLSAVCLGQEAQSDADLPAYEALREVGGIKIDGKLDEPDWIKAQEIPLQFPWEQQTGAKQKTIVKLLWNDANLYVGYDCQDEEITAAHDQRDDPTYKDDCVEIFISPNQQSLDLYYGLEMNCRAVL